MKRDVFVDEFNKFISQTADRWLPEEAPESDFMDIMQTRIKEHNDSIIAVLKQEDK